MLEDNARLNYLPYLTGCQQTILTYSNQASWSALSQPVVENTLNGVWSLRVGGCGVTSAPAAGDDDVDTLTVATSG